MAQNQSQTQQQSSQNGQPPANQELMDNPAVQRASYQLFSDSTYGNARTERSMWVTYNDGQYGFVRWPWSAEAGKEHWAGPPPAGAVAIVHVHPNSSSKNPSERDHDLANGKQSRLIRMPVYVLHREGIYKAVPGIKEPVEVRGDRKWWQKEFNSK